MTSSSTGTREGRKEGWDPTAAFVRADLLRWLYVGRMALVSGILLGALWTWGQADPSQTFLATGMFVAALLVTVGSVWHTHIRGSEPSRNFLYSQVVFDVLLVTGVVHVTGGGGSPFAWLYILVISEGALLLPLPGGVLIGAFAAILYFADIVWGHSETLSGAVVLQIGLFAVVALATGLLGDRLRRAGMALGAVQSELYRLRMDTGDILATISTGILTVDGEGRLGYINPAAERLLSLSGRRWMGAPVLDVVAAVAPELTALLRRSIDHRLTLFRRTAVVERSGEKLTLGVSTTTRAEEGMPTTVTAIFQDITDLQKLEAMRRRNERLEAVAELSAAMAHEIKNPLASIRSAVEQFSKPSLGGENRELLTRMVVRESDRLSRLLSDFIDFSGVRIGKLEAVRVEELLRECVSVVRRHPEVVERGVRVEVEAVEPGLRLPADADLLHRALFNLLLNAAQFSPPDGTVHVGAAGLSGRPGAWDVDVLDPIRIWVRDSGPGIPDEAVSRIFDPFFTTRDGGSGLGLSVVHRAVEAHRGVVLADRSSEGGAEFNIYLPGEAAPAPVGART